MREAVVATVLAAVMLSVISSRPGPAQATDPATYSGSEILAGILTGSGPVAESFPAVVHEGAAALSPRQVVAIQTAIRELDAIDSRFMEEFQRKVSSGDPWLARQGIEEATTGLVSVWDVADLTHPGSVEAVWGQGASLLLYEWLYTVIYVVAGGGTATNDLDSVRAEVWLREVTRTFSSSA